MCRPINRCLPAQYDSRVHDHPTPGHCVFAGRLGKRGQGRRPPTSTDAFGALSLRLLGDGWRVRDAALVCA
jgi:hypothetical protein